MKLSISRWQIDWGLWLASPDLFAVVLRASWCCFEQPAFGACWLRVVVRSRQQQQLFPDAYVMPFVTLRNPPLAERGVGRSRTMKSGTNRESVAAANWRWGLTHRKQSVRGFRVWVTGPAGRGYLQAVLHRLRFQREGRGRETSWS